MISQRLLQELEAVARRYRRLYVWTALSATWLVAALAGVGLLALGRQGGWTSAWTAPTLAVLALLATGIAVVVSMRAARDLRWTARRIEGKHPELQTLLLAAVEQKPNLPEGKFGFLQETVIRGALTHHRQKDWEEAVSERKTRLMQLASLATLALLVLVIGGLRSHAAQRKAVFGGASGSGSSSETRLRVAITPGDTEIERGTTLIVTARFDGALPDDAALVYGGESGETIRLPMSLSLSDPMFGGRVPAVHGDLSYRVEYAGQTTREYRVSVYEHPELIRADARLIFPEYTALEEKRIEDTRRITAVEGTRVTLYCRLNKPVESARLIDEEDQPVELTAEAGDPTVYWTTRTLEKSVRYRLHLVDAQGRKNKQPPEFVLGATPNRPPDLKIAMPARDVRVSPIEELATKASAWDDFGLTRYGISYSLAGNPPRDVVLGDQTLRNQRREIEYLIDFESLEAEPDRLASYYFWAEDVGPDSQPRRTLGDMYFAEVRHFEEIFRQGEQPPGGDSQQQQQQQQEGNQGNAQQAQELAEKQKEIINATWKVVRRETAAKPSDQFAADGKELQTAQQEALDQLAQLAERLEDAESQQHAAAVDKHMTEALTHLTEAAQSSSPQALRPALAAEQAAYQALLKLRAREHRVIRGNPRQRQQQQAGSASGSQSRAQQQLEQLQLTNEENRYETQREATAQQDQQQRETRQVLSRLRELARRQSDLNERLKELQSALEEAKTEEEREEIQRQLKRLRDEEQQILRDTDELRERMQQPQNQERMAESRQDLEQTRENIRQTTEALTRGQVSRAVASGTRAERELSEMREEFRRQASDRFSEEVRELRDDARKLDENERRLAERLANLDKTKPEAGRLRDSPQREQIREGFQQQGTDLGRLLGDVQETIEEAEQSEPLMTEQLYDTLRRARQQRLENVLEVTRELLDRGFVDQARSAEAAAGQGIEELKQGVEEAAENVLGDEDEALARAHEALTDLAQQLNEEIERGETQQPRGQESADSQAGGQPPEGQQPQPRQSDNRQPNRREPSGPPGQPDEQSDRPPGQPRPQPPSGGDAQQPDSQSAPRQAGPGGRQDPARPGSLDRFLEADRPASGPIAGDDFLPWSDRLRDVEEMLGDQQLRSEAAAIRDRARGIRRDVRGGSQGPSWDIVRKIVAEPLCELRDRVAEELLRRGAKETMVPIDRDPVPPKYADQVRRYYEQLGSGR